MKFNKKYPTAKHNDEFNCDGDCVVYFDSKGKCFRCNKVTHFASLSFETWFCSEECLNVTWEDYNNSLEENKI